MSDDLTTRLYAWLGKWGHKIPDQAEAEFREAMAETIRVGGQEIKFVAKVRAAKPTVPCRRGQLTINPQTQTPFDHEIDQTLGYCLWCGEGAPKKEGRDRFANLLENGMIETVPCAEHGSHRLEVRPDGSYDAPDCSIFKKGVNVEEESDRA